MIGGKDNRSARTGRRAVLAGALSLTPALALGQQPQQQRRQSARDAEAAMPPLIFVHGNGDSGALWINNLWRFETNGWRRNLLFAPDLPYPEALRDDAKSEPFRSSTAEQMAALARIVDDTRKWTRRPKVALIASSRGGNTVRNYLKNGGGAAHVSHAVLCGVPNRGIWISDQLLPGNEFNGAAPFLRQLNAGADDLIPGVELMAIRSDKADKYAQPDGRYIGAPGKPTGVGFDAAALRGARNVFLEGLDHREVAFHKLAFAAMYEFIAGKPPATLFIAQEPNPVLNGRVTGQADGVYTNLPVANADVEIHEVDPRSGERRGSAPVHRRTTSPDGWWGPFAARPDVTYEFVLRMAGEPVTHIYRPPFLRSSDLVHLRPVAFAKGDETAGAVVTMSRPRGYFGPGRDKYQLDGKSAPGIAPDGVPTSSTARQTFDAQPRTVLATFNNETIAVRTWPARENRIVVAEFLN
ncbi:MAG: hydrolase [Alphaproteobacteria bacterium]|nr:hydrolase [Alphaproteobacteria bacterium]